MFYYHTLYKQALVLFKEKHRKKLSFYISVINPNMNNFVSAKQDHLSHLINDGHLNFMWFISLFAFILYMCFKFVSKEKDKKDKNGK